MDNQEYIKVSKAIRNYKTAWLNVALFLAFTVLNGFFVATCNIEEGYTYFLFSFYSVIQLIAAGKVMQYRDPANGDVYLGIMVVLALIVLAVLVVFWLLAKKRRWAMIVLLVLVSLDTAVVVIDIFYAQQFSLVIDVVFHALMIYYFVIGIKAAKELALHFPQGVQLTIQQLNEAYRLETGIDPVTRAPVTQGMPGTNPSVAPVSYDPMTGQPISGNAPAAPVRYDPMTGQPISSNAPAAPVGYDPMTGQPISGNAPAAPVRYDPMTGEKIEEGKNEIATAEIEPGRADENKSDATAGFDKADFGEKPDFGGKPDFGKDSGFGEDSQK